VDRPVLREVGGFRSVRRYVDAQLLTAVTAAGGAIYRTHGLGYVLRRNESGHTWEVDLDYLLDPSRVERSWTGLTPSRLMEL
ncbi:MAG: glycosyl transferase family 2, partial [Nocardioides sp.]|nr:glycosyl transferase family 2 [Nocardioides sp.]